MKAMVFQKALDFCNCLCSTIPNGQEVFFRLFQKLGEILDANGGKTVSGPGREGECFQNRIQYALVFLDEFPSFFFLLGFLEKLVSSAVGDAILRGNMVEAFSSEVGSVDVSLSIIHSFIVAWFGDGKEGGMDGLS